MDLCIVIGKGTFIQLQGDRFGFARLQTDLGEVSQLLFRTDGIACSIFYIELDNLFTVYITGICNIYRYQDLILRFCRNGRDHIWLGTLCIICGRAADRMAVDDELGIGVPEACVAETVSEWEKDIHFPFIIVTVSYKNAFAVMGLILCSGEI